MIKILDVLWKTACIACSLGWGGGTQRPNSFPHRLWKTTRNTGHSAKVNIFMIVFGKLWNIFDDPCMSSSQVCDLKSLMDPVVRNL